MHHQSPPSTGAGRLRPCSLFVVLFCLTLMLPRGPGVMVAHTAPAPRAIKKIKAVGDRNYPPYEFLDEAGQPAGFNIDLLRAVCEAMGIAVEVRLLPWNEAMRQLGSGAADVMTGMFYSEERARTFSFSAPFAAVKQTIFSRRDAPLCALEDLRGRDVLVQNGDIMHEFLRGQSRSVNIVPVTDPIDALRQLEAGRHDCALLAKLPALYLINKHDLVNIAPPGPTLHQTDYCFAVRRDSEILLARLDEGLMLARASGKYQQIYQKWFGEYDRREARREFYNLLAMLLIPLLLIMAAVLAWVHTLRRRVAEATNTLRDELEQRRAAEMAIRRGEEHLRITLDSIGDAVISTDAASRVALMNPVAERLTGWPAREAAGLPMADVFKIVNTQTRAPMKDPVGKVLLHGQVIGLANHTTLISRTGKEHQIADSAAPIQDINGDILGVVMVFRDVTTEYRIQRKLRESEHRFRALFENAIVAVAAHEIVLDDQGTPVDYIFLDANPAFETHTGLKVADVLGKRVTQIHPGIEKTHLIATYGQVALTGEPASFDFYFEAVRRHYMITAYQIAPRQFAAVFLDISAQKRAENDLRASEQVLKKMVFDKEALLREVHHRVKNNLAVITGLINLQQEARDDNTDNALLKDLSRRIRAMAILHEMLYKSENLSRINLHTYFQALGDALRESFMGMGDIQLSMQAPDIGISLDAAVPCGLIINELVTNAFKHAFPDGKPASDKHDDNCRVSVKASRHDGECVIVVQDNGRGLPKDLDWSTSPTLGLRLIRMLTQHQLRGAIEVDQRAGALFRIRFKNGAD